MADHSVGASKLSGEAGPDEGRQGSAPQPAPGQRPTERAATPTAVTATGESSERQLADAECERLLRNTKRQVKQMMEEAVTKKFIHEASNSITALCVAIDACLLHQLKRRTLGLFKTNSSTALVRKIAKSCPEAQFAVDMVGEEERRQQDELKRQKKLQTVASHPGPAAASSLAGRMSNSASAPARQVAASNSSVHKRNLWIKCALIEKRLVPIVEHLAANAALYYEPEALMANRVSAQLLCSLLLGPCALEFSRSKTNDFYQFEEPSAEELLKRHKLSNPIACLCPSSAGPASPPARLQAGSSLTHSRSPHCEEYGQVSRSMSTSTSGPSAGSQRRPAERGQHHSGSDTAKSEQDSPLATRRIARPCRRRPSTLSQSSLTEVGREKENTPRQASSCASSIAGSPLTRPGELERRRPLALRSSIKTGTLVTECHHSACQEISSHQQTRGYSFTSASNSSLGNHTCQAGLASSRRLELPAASCAIDPARQPLSGGSVAQEANWSAWSPRMLHETLHQNSKSSLLYAKNNVLLETQAHGTIAGYLSLHQASSSDLILKWIPNQLINGGQSQAASAAADNFPAPEQAAANGDQREAREDGEQPDPLSSLGSLDGHHGHQDQPTERTRSRGAQNLAAAAPGRAPPVAVGSSYLDLVISLSVSRIVLLHCHFSEIASAGAFFASATEHFSPSDNAGDDPEAKVLGGELEETLVLVEADGVQRAPFKFPKGGLRWFLSCLENGLVPHRYLEPAIRADENDGAGCDGRLADPLRALDSLGCATSGQEGAWPDSPSASSEPTLGAVSSSASRLEALLRRLPSLRRTQPAVSDDKASRSSELASASDATDNSRPESRGRSTPSPGANEMRDAAAAVDGKARRHRRRSILVYRIVSVHQLDWSQQTPPLSALSADSPLALAGKTNGLLHKQHCERPPLSGDSTGVGPRFSWSLSRLARFSSRNNSTSSSNSAGPVSRTTSTVGQQSKSTTLGSLTSLLHLSTNKTLDSFESADGNQQSFDPNGNVGSHMKRDSSSELIRIEAKLNDLKKSSTEELAVLRNQSIQTLCDSMRKQILARAFYGWLVHCRRMKIVRTHLTDLVNEDRLKSKRSGKKLPRRKADWELSDWKRARRCGLTWELWREFQSSTLAPDELAHRVNWLVYYGGVQDNKLRAEVWPFLLGHYKFGESPQDRWKRDDASRSALEASARDWVQIERVIKERDSEILAANMAKAARRQQLDQDQTHGHSSMTSEATDQDSTELLREDEDEIGSQPDDLDGGGEAQKSEQDKSREHGQDDNETECGRSACSAAAKDDETNDKSEPIPPAGRGQSATASKARAKRQRRMRRRFRLESTGSVGSDASITDQFGNNIHRIDKDVQRCDRNFWYFKDTENLNRLRRIMCSYVWHHLDVGYVQGMCDLAAPLLVIFDHDELMAYNCFSQLMKRMVANFPHGSAMDQHFEHLKYLMQVLDPKLFEVLQNNGDYTHFYFCYRWLLLDFKRELAYEDVYRVWEAIWSARVAASEHFVVFLALAMVRYYRNIIIENNMDFTDTIKFFNEMAERHNARKIIALAQDCVTELESLIEA